MTDFVTGVSRLLVIGTLITHVLLLVGLVVSLSSPKKKRQDIVKEIATHAPTLAWIIALGATLGSLFYSNIAGFEPCLLCWWQRALLYPLAVIYTLAYIQRKHTILPYGLILTIPGIILSLYHCYIEWGGTPLIPCDALSGAATCARRYVFEFGYISIPMMALTTFVILTIVLVSYAYQTRRKAN